jgi:hypothetical protein
MPVYEVKAVERFWYVSRFLIQAEDRAQAERLVRAGRVMAYTHHVKPDSPGRRMLTLHTVVRPPGTYDPGGVVDGIAIEKSGEVHDAGL